VAFRTAEELADALRELSAIWDPAMCHHELLEEAADTLERLSAVAAAGSQDAS
jgi:hypothetical protein